MCTVCNTHINVVGVLTECPKYEIKRIHYFGNKEIKMNEILKRGNSQQNSVLNFLRSTDLFSEI